MGTIFTAFKTLNFDSTNHSNQCVVHPHPSLGLFYNRIHLLDGVSDQKLKAIFEEEWADIQKWMNDSKENNYSTLLEWNPIGTYYLYEIQINAQFTFQWLSTIGLDVKIYSSIKSCKVIRLNGSSLWDDFVFNRFIRHMHEANMLQQIIFIFPKELEEKRSEWKYKYYPSMKTLNGTDEAIQSFLDEETVFPIFKGEKVYFADRAIRYVFQPCEGSQQMLVVFSAMSPDETARYNYLKVLKDEPCHRLFILDDFGQRGTFNIGVDGNHEIETSVISLLHAISREIGVGFEKMIALGTSKAGGIATLFALKYHFEGLIVGGSVYHIGDWMLENDEERNKMRLTMTPPIYKDHIDLQRAYLNQLMYQVDFKKKPKTQIFIQTIENDPYRKGVLEPFLKFLDFHQLPYEFDIYPGKRHNLLGESYPEYLRQVLTSHFYDVKDFQEDVKKISLWERTLKRFK